MPEVPDNYEQQEGLQAQLDYMDQGQEDPEVQENINQFQDWTSSHEQNVMNGIHNEDMGELANYNIPEQEEMRPPMYTPEAPSTEQNQDIYNLESPATEEEPEPALPPDEERYEEEGGAPGQGYGA